MMKNNVNNDMNINFYSYRGYEYAIRNAYNWITGVILCNNLTKYCNIEYRMLLESEVKDSYAYIMKQKCYENTNFYNHLVIQIDDGSSIFEDNSDNIAKINTEKVIARVEDIIDYLIDVRGIKNGYNTTKD